MFQSADGAELRITKQYCTDEKDPNQHSNLSITP